jgi:hypothetical protein
MATLKDILGEAYREDMTVADIESAIASMKLADLSSGDYVSKGKLMDYETRAKKAEKALAEKLTEEEKAQIELAKKEEYYKSLEKENARNKYITKLGKSIKDEKVLNEIADLYANGDFATAIDKQNEYLAKYHSELEKNIKADLMKQNPQPQPQNGNGGITKEQFDAMGVQERTKLYNEQPEVYKQFTQ